MAEKVKLVAKAKQDYKFGPVIAFSGVEFVKYEWRPVPAGFEEQAQAHDLLDTKPASEEQAQAHDLLDTKPASEADKPEEEPAVEPEETLGTAEQYLADKKGTADKHVEEVVEEDKKRRRKKKDE